MGDAEVTNSRRASAPAINPDTGKADFLVHIPQHRIQWAKNMGIGAIKELSESVAHVLATPTRVYRGIKRDSEDDQAGKLPGWLCYIGKPPRRYDYETGIERSANARVLLVYVNSENVVYFHRWEEENPRVPGEPADTEDRFCERLI